MNTRIVEQGESGIGSTQELNKTASPKLGEYRINKEDIPPFIVEVSAKRLNIELDDLKIKSSRNGGSYKGDVLFADSNFVVQTVGKDGKSAIVHRTSELEFNGEDLKTKLEKNQLSGTNIQVHYNDVAKGSVYPFDTEKLAPPKLGDYRIAKEEIPAYINEVSAKKLDIELNDLKINSCRSGGAYKGKVIYTTNDYIVQTVGKDGKSAVVHRTSDLDFQNQNLQWRAENKRLGSTDIQVHYNTDGKGSVYPYSPDKVKEKDSQQRIATKNPPPKTDKNQNTDTITEKNTHTKSRRAKSTSDHER